MSGEYFDVVTPTTGKKFTQCARGAAKDIELALDAAHAAADAWGKTSATERAGILLQIASIIQANNELLAYVETCDNGKPIRETLNADIPLAADHFVYFAGCLRAQEGSLTQLDDNTVAYHISEPLGVVGQIIPWNFPILMAAWVRASLIMAAFALHVAHMHAHALRCPPSQKLAPALAAGNAVVLKPAETTPVSIMVLMSLIGHLFPPGVLNVVNGFGAEAGAALASSNRIAKIAFTGSTAVGRMVAAAAAKNLIPATLELGGKSPNVFFSDIMAADDELFDKALEGFVMFAFNSGEVCTCPSRALIQEDIYEAFMKRALPRVAAIRMGNPLDVATALGAQNSSLQLSRILKHIENGKAEGAQALIGGGQAMLPGAEQGGYYVQPTVFKGTNNMRIFQEVCV